MLAIHREMGGGRGGSLKASSPPCSAAAAAAAASVSSSSCTCCSDSELRRGPWTPDEDALLLRHMKSHGNRGNWRKVPKSAGLMRCGKSCRLRWLNYLRPDLKRGAFTEDEDALIIKLHSLLGNRWSLIAGRIPGRSDNEIKNYWNFHLGKKLLMLGINPKTHKPMSSSPVVSSRAASRKKKSSSKLSHSLSFSSISSSITDDDRQTMVDIKQEFSSSPGISQPIDRDDLPTHGIDPVAVTPSAEHNSSRAAMGPISWLDQCDQQLGFHPARSIPGAGNLSLQQSVTAVDSENAATEHDRERIRHDQWFQFAANELEIQNQMVMLGTVDQVSSIWLAPSFRLDDWDGQEVDNGLIFDYGPFYRPK